MLVVFTLFQLTLIKMPKKEFKKISLSCVVVILGLFIFLTGIDYGFAFAGKYVGSSFLGEGNPEWLRWLLIPVIFILGVAITMTEPAVTVLGKQLGEVTEEKIRPMTIRVTLAIGIGLAAAIAIVKILTQTNILFFLLPLYGVAMILMMFTPRIFVGLAFDSRRSCRRSTYLSTSNTTNASEWQGQLL